MFTRFSIVRIFEVPYSPAVRIPGFHPGRPGSTPGMGTHFFKCRNFAGVLFSFYQALSIVKFKVSTTLL